ncbi:hypothetical protein [Nodosilinea sp. E11]|uniref:hypothetical protein n=1 Tax=Nodosilinea sp. E11 TaxID=3037479 RepID=UPI0029348BA1|nr:hypothetical protein [Nodosilinea sp. E11]WOD39904.1 hypothetical protein RRF56_03760 [Nodosilinea sp. E11]
MAQPFPHQRLRQLLVIHRAPWYAFNSGHLHLPSATDLPTAFPQVEAPHFHYGDRLRWIPHGNATDWGLVIGRFYSYAPHRRRWQWCYLIWLDLASPSAAWVRADIAWEDDLDPFDEEPIR